MRRRLFGVLTVAVLVAACSGNSASPSASTAPSVAPSSAAPSSAAPSSAAPSASASAGAIDLTNTTYKPTPAGKTGGTVVLAEWQYPDTVNPYFAQAETDIEVSGSMFNNLVSTTNDLRYTPDLASNVPTLDNGDVKLAGSGMDVTWKLKPNMQWSNGDPINCADIEGTWKWVMDKDNTGLAGGTTGWEDVSGVDGGTGTTCVMHFSKVYEGYLSLVNPLLPAKYISSIPVKDAPTKLYPLGNLSSGVYSGPYIPTEAKTDAQITTKPNPMYKTVSGHAPYLDSLIWKYYGDAETMIKGFSAGEYDLGQDLTDADIPSLATISPQTSVVVHDSLTYELNAFNSKSLKAKFGDDWSTIVKAIKLATDREAIAKGPLGGNVTVANNFVSPLTWYYKNVGGTTAADATTAASLLQQAGWTKSGDYLTKNGKTLELNYCTTTRQYRVNTLKLIASQLKPLGIKVNVNSKPATDVFGDWNGTKADTLCNLIHGNFDVAQFAYVSPLDPIGAYNVYHSSGIPDNAPHNGQNVTRTSIPELDQAYDTVKSTVDFVKVRDAMATVQDIYGSDKNTFELPLFNRKDVWLVSPKIQNFTGNPTTSAAEWNIGDWWLNG